MKRIILANTGAQLLGRLGTASISFLTTILLARMLGSFYYGEYITIVSYIAFFYALVDFGINPLYLKMFGSDLRSTFAQLVGLRTLLALVVICVAVGGAHVISAVTGGLTPLVRVGITLASFSILASALTTSTGAIFQAKSRFDQVTYALIVGSGVGLCGLILFLFLPSIQAKVLTAALLVSIGSFVTMILSLKRVSSWNIPIIPAYDPSRWNMLLRTSFPFGISLFFNLIYFRIDILLLSFYRGSDQVGAYGLAYKFFEFFISIPTFYFTSLYPRLLEKGERHDEIRQTMIHSARYLFFLSLVLAGGVVVGAPFLLLIKQDYAFSVGLLKGLAILLPLFFLSSPLMWIFILEGRQRWLPWIYGSGMLINSMLNMISIPRYGAWGAVVTTGITEIFILIAGSAILFNAYEKRK